MRTNFWWLLSNWCRCAQLLSLLFNRLKVVRQQQRYPCAMTPSSSRWYSVVQKGVISSMWKSAVQCLGNRSPDPLTIPTDVHRQLMCIGKWHCIIRKQSCVLCRKVLLKTKCFIPPPSETFRAAGILLSGLTCPVHPWVSLWVCATRRTLWTPYQSINQSIIYLFWAAQETSTMYNTVSNRTQRHEALTGARN